MAGNLENLVAGNWRTLQRVPTGLLVATVLVAYWGSVLFGETIAFLWVLQAFAGSVLLLFVPGALLVGLLGLAPRMTGRFLPYSVGVSVALLAVETTVLSVVLPSVGLERPIGIVPVGLTTTAIVLALSVAVERRGIAVPTSLVLPDRPTPALGVLLLLPVSAAVAAGLMDRWSTNVGMYVFVGLVVVVVLLSATRALPRSLYPGTVLSVSLSVLLHRNLLTDHVVGADIQALYGAAVYIVDVGAWSPAMAGSAAALPVVTTVPAAVSMLTGLSVATTYKTLYVFVFALTPLGLYYLVRDAFDDRIALYGSLFFSFYHVSFFFTPGKQLVSELFVVLLLMTLWSDTSRWTRYVALGLLSAGVVATHYAMTYVFGITVLLAAVGLLLGRRLFDRFGRSLPVGYPLLLLVGTSVWYRYTAPELLRRITSLPVRLFDQVAALVTRGYIEGSGASYAAAQTTLLETVQLYLYLLLTVLLAVGLAWRSLSHLRRLYRGEDPGRVDFTALAIPLFVFLGSSYVFVFNLWADRVYQLVLVVLAPFAAYGFGRISAATWTLLRRRGAEAPARPRWGLLAVLLALLFAFNSGMAFALVGSAQTSTFNPDANDLVFRDGELAAANWLERRPEIDRIDASHPPAIVASAPDASSDATGAEPGQASERVQIYTDPFGAQLFRAVLSERYYNVDVVQVKSKWRPTFDASTIGEGYVFVRKRGVTAMPADGTLPPSYFSHEDVRAIEARGEVVFSNDDVVVYKVEGGSGS